MDRVYTLELGENLDLQLKQFQKQLKEGEQIVLTQPAGNKLIITTRETKVRNKKLLLEASE